MSTRVSHEPVRLRVPHTCATHEDVRTTEFVATQVRRYDNGDVLYSMTRCDGSPMDVWGDGAGVEVPAMTSDEAINDRAVEKHDAQVEAAHQVCPVCGGEGFGTLCGVCYTRHVCYACGGEGVAP